MKIKPQPSWRYYEYKGYDIYQPFKGTFILLENGENIYVSKTLKKVKEEVDIWVEAKKRLKK